MEVAEDDASSCCTISLWEKADWASMCRDLNATPWDAVLQGGAECKAQALTSQLLALQTSGAPL